MTAAVPLELQTDWITLRKGERWCLNCCETKKEEEKKNKSYKFNDGVYEVITFFKKLSSGGSVKEKTKIKQSMETCREWCYMQNLELTNLHLGLRLCMRARD